MTAPIGSGVSSAIAGGSVGGLRKALDMQQLMAAELLALLTPSASGSDSVQLSAAAMQLYHSGS